jgi:hypothetical protein
MTSSPGFATVIVNPACLPNDIVSKAVSAAKQLYPKSVRLQEVYISAAIGFYLEILATNDTDRREQAFYYGHDFDNTEVIKG